MSFNGWPFDTKQVNEYWCKRAVYDKADLEGKRDIIFEHEGAIQELGQDLLTINDPHEYLNTLLQIAFTTISLIELAGIDPEKAWDSYMINNMTGYVDTSDLGRLGLPTIKETEGTEALDHTGNMGHLGELLHVDESGC